MPPNTTVIFLKKYIKFNILIGLKKNKKLIPDSWIKNKNFFLLVSNFNQFILKKKNIKFLFKIPCVANWKFNKFTFKL